ncbi:MAG: saccharopine dehydrogenase (NAD+, L-lysine-forming) [Enterobacterales bacterium]|jgi:saccharopine dehydrogenase (NAD+, L-lysine-forming)
MLKSILRKEHKNSWERRTPLIPSSISNLSKSGFQCDVEQSDIRIFADSAYEATSAKLFDTPDNHQLIIGIKEPPVDSIKSQQVHLCFSHTIKGQEYNMPLLQRFIDQKATLIDYELMTDSSGKRTIAFGEHAGIAGAVDSFWIAGQKFKNAGKNSILDDVKQTVHYQTIENLKSAFSNIQSEECSNLTSEPIQVVIIGSGNVGRGAEKVCQWLGFDKISTTDFINNQLPKGNWYTVLSSQHLHERLAGGEFKQDEFRAEGKKAYKSIFETYLGRFNILFQTSFWTDYYPKHLDTSQILRNKDINPQVLGDISCDIDGSFSCTKISSTIDKPAFTYIAQTDSIKDGISDAGITVMSIDNLPCELSLDASKYFSQKLEQYTPSLMSMDLNLSYDDLVLHEELKKAVVVYKGELTENFTYLKDYLNN